MNTTGDLYMKRNRNEPRHLPRRRLALIAALVLGWPMLASADCTLRATRPAETEFNARAMAALVAAFPPVSDGVTTVIDRPFDFKKPPGIYEVLCEGTKEGEFSISTRRQYIRKHSEAERKYFRAQYDALTSEFQALKKLPADKKAEEMALRQRSNAAFQASRDAEKAGDKAAAQERAAEYRTLRIEADGIEAQHLDTVKVQMSDLDKRRIAIEQERQTADVVLSMNLQRLPAARADNSSGAYGAASRGRSVGLQVHNLSFSVNGVDGSLRQALAGAIDRARLQALVGKPLPSIAQSEAYAGAAVAVTVANIATDGMPAAPLTTASPGALPTSPPAVAAPALASEATAAAKPTGPAADPLKKGLEAVNLLRGLLGR